MNQLLLLWFLWNSEDENRAQFLWRHYFQDPSFWSKERETRFREITPIMRPINLNCWVRHALPSNVSKAAGQVSNLKSYALYDGGELISGVLTDFVSRIDIVIRRVPGTQCE